MREVQFGCFSRKVEPESRKVSIGLKSVLIAKFVVEFAINFHVVCVFFVNDRTKIRRLPIKYNT